MTGSSVRELLLFDVNETLLDLRALRPHFATMFGDERVTAEWFGLMLRLSLVATVTHTYVPFDQLGRHALASTAEKNGVKLDPGAADAVLHEMLRLPAHADVVPALTQLREAGYRMAALTNSAPTALSCQLGHAGLTGFFERRFSVEAVGLFKPAPETYRYAANQLGVEIASVLMIAAHDWDVTGAIRAGAKGAFVARTGMVLGASAETPDVVGADLLEIAAKLLALAP